MVHSAPGIPAHFQLWILSIHTSLLLLLLFFVAISIFSLWASFAFQSFFAILSLFIYIQLSRPPQSWRVPLLKLLSLLSKLHPVKRREKVQHQHLFKVPRGRKLGEDESFNLGKSLPHTNSKQVMSDILKTSRVAQGGDESYQILSCLYTVSGGKM